MSRNRIMRRRKGKGLVDSRGVPISPKEAARLKAEAIDIGGVYVELFPATDDEPARVSFSFSAEAHAALVENAARTGMDPETAMRTAWEVTLAGMRTEEPKA